MATIKFSGFTNEAVDAADTQLVGYKVGDATANYRYSIAQLATALSPSISNFYTADGTIGTTRKALITDTIQFRNAGDTSDIFTLNTDGTFTLGLGATATGGLTAVAVGNLADATTTKSVAVGYDATTSNGDNGIAIGNGPLSYGDGIAIGENARAYNTCIGIGYRSGDHTAAQPGRVAIGNKVKNSVANSIILAARNSSASTITNAVANSFNVYLADASTAGDEDLQIVRGGESTLRTSLKITGQGYTELYANATNLVVDWNESNVQTVTISTSVPVFAPTNPRAGATYILTITQGATPVTVDWNSLVKWPAGSPPTLSAVTGKIDVITLICYDEGNNYYYGSAVLDLA